VACRGGEHDSPRITGTSSGTDGYGRGWTEVHWTCGACGTNWTVVSGPGVK